jgi:hypothetical protein
MIWVHLFKKRRREVKVDPKLGGQWNVPSLVVNGMWRKNNFSPLSTFPPTNLLKPSIFSFDLKVLLYHGYRPSFTHFFSFPWFINYDYASQCNKSSTLSLSIWFWLKIWIFSSLWNCGVAHGHILRAPSCTSEWRTTFGVISRFDRNITSLWWRFWTSKSARLSWSWTPWTWYYRISLNFCTLVKLLQVDPAFGDELETICEGCYETEDTCIFAWSSVPSVGHYCWLCSLICWLPPNSKADYLIRTIYCTIYRTIRRILYFLQLWTISMA